jgi:non-canonical poly(A) RNA polymerase PAPD5/7
MSDNEEESEESKKNNQKQNSKNTDDSFHPWIKPNSKCYITNGMLKLHYEILDFCDFIQLNNEEKKLRDDTFNFIKTTIESNYPEYNCILYGSFKTDLSLPDSDIDVLIISKVGKEEDISKNKILDEILKKINELLLSTKSFSYLEIIKAKVPIIKCTYKETNINVDISFFRKNGFSAVKTIEKVIDNFPEIKPLMLVIKYTLRQRQLNEIYKGGVSSFIIFSMLYYYIADFRKKIIDDIKKGKKETELTLGHFLVGFFDFYGFQFNYEKLGISIRNGGFIYIRTDEGKNLLSIENFQDISQDMGKSCFKFRKVIETFKFARDSLYYPPKSPVISYLSGFIFPDDILRKRADNN